MSVQNTLTFQAPMTRNHQDTGWFGGVATLIDTVRRRAAVSRAARSQARSRAEVMSLARRYASTQPEFAKDLYAAAGCDFDL